MPQTSDPSEYGPESEAELGARFEKALELVRVSSMPLVERMSEDLKLPTHDVVALAIVFFSRYLQLTQDEDSFVLVVKGTVKPYDSALEALLDSARNKQFEPLLDYLKTYSPLTGEG
jgi:hypothetical protein